MLRGQAWGPQATLTITYRLYNTLISQSIIPRRGKQHSVSVRRLYTFYSPMEVNDHFDGQRISGNDFTHIVDSLGDLFLERGSEQLDE